MLTAAVKMEHNQNTIAAINHATRHRDQISESFWTFLSVAEKNWLLSRDYLGSWGQVLVAIAVIERFKQGMYCRYCPPEQKSDR